MTFRGSPQEVAAEIGRRRRELPKALRQAERQTVEQAQAEAKRISQGQYKTAQLIAMGHPYSKRRPRPPDDPAIINFQSGDLFRGWRRKTGNWSGGTLFSYVFNVSDHAAEIEAGGTSKSLQIARPIARRVQQRVRAQRLHRLEAAVRRVL